MSLQDKAFLAMCRDARLPAPVQEHQITDTRRFRWDFAWPDYKLALEVQGAVWSGGAHGRPTGIMRDYAKGNLAASLGWRTLQVTPQELLKSSTIELVRASLLAGLVEHKTQKPEMFVNESEISLNASKASLSEPLQTKTNNHSKR